MTRTPLYDAHLAAAGRMVDFAGWEMPLQYSGVIDEYHAVRSQAGLFDVSHMGRIAVTGPRAAEWLDRLTTNNVQSLAVGQAQYSMVCNDRGGIQDDVFVYHPSPDHYLVCVNASNRAKIVSWFEGQARGQSGCSVQDRSEALAQLAIQGPTSRSVLTALGIADAQTLKLRHCVTVTIGGVSSLLARTGYTGELGFELYVPADVASTLWDQCLSQRSTWGVKPAGLGARDLLRLEMAYLLYGNDISEDTSPIEAGVAWTIAFDKPAFVGQTALLAQRSSTTKTLIAFELLEKGVPRQGFPICTDEPSRTPIGEVTSGNLSPLLQKGIGLGYVPPTHTLPGTPLIIDIRGKAAPAVVVKPPFYRPTRHTSA